MTTVGFELEMSDIKTGDAALIVYEDLTYWQDRWGQYNKPQLHYDRWHLTSDGSIRNSNGTRCMTTYIDEDGKKKKANPSKISKDRLKWQGAELISPVLTLDEIRTIDGKRQQEFEGFVSKFIEKDAVFEKHLFDSLHVHISVEEVAYRDLMYWVEQIYNVQDTLDSLGNDWRKRNKFIPSDLIKFKEAADKQDEFEFTQLLKKTKDGEEKFWDHDDIRRIVDISHAFRVDRPNTIEFRCYSPVPTWEYITSCIELSLWLVEQWKAKTPYRDYYETLREKANSIKKLDESYYAIKGIGRGEDASLPR